MSSASEEPPGQMEGGPPEEPAANLKESCEQSKSQLESLKEIMLRNKQSLKKKEEEIQEYARKLTKFKTRAKLSKRSRDDTSGESTPKSISEASFSEPLEDEVDDISQAKTLQAKSSLLQRKLAEDKKIFEQRSKEITESKRAVEEKVEAIRQQLDEREQQTPIIPVVLSQGAAPLIQMSFQQDKDNKIAELSNKIIELEGIVLDLRENLREKDSVIDSKTKAVTLMSADLSLKGKTTLDTLEDTKDEMRTMQEHFVLLETSLKSKNDNLLQQLEEKNDRITKLEEMLKGLEDQLYNRKLAESASIDFSRSTMDTLADTKEAMKSMQENFVLVESSLKSKNDHLLKQLEERETKLAEAKETIFKLESNVGICRPPEIGDLEFKLDKSEENNRVLLDEKFELQKNNAELQNRIIVLQSTNGNGVIVEKDNRIAELESLIEELKQSNQLLEEESKAELQKQVTDLLAKNEDISNKVIHLETIVHDLETEKNQLVAKIPSESKKADEKVGKLTKEMEEMNKGLIKMKAQHKSKVKNLQRQLESFRKVSDVNAELVKLGNQVALLEEEKGNLQLSLVDFDELKATTGDWKEQIADLEGKVNAQAKEIQGHIDAIAALENQKLDLTQELHTTKQEVSALEEENAESENLRVTAEMKIVDLEEQLEAINKVQSDQKQADLSSELSLKIEGLTKENEELQQKLFKYEEKGTSDSGSTESFETLQETDKNDLLKRIEELSHKNNELLKKLSNLEEKMELNAESTESFETIQDTDKNDLMKRIDALTRENSDLVIKLSKIEEKGSSDTGSTESFEKIPEHGDNSVKLELLTRENHNLVIKLTKLEEKFEESGKIQEDALERFRKLEQENNDLLGEIEKLKSKEEERPELKESQGETIAALESEIESCKKLIEEQKETMEDLKLKLTDKEEELERKIVEINQMEVTGADVQALRKDLQDSTLVIEEWKLKCDDMEAKMKDLEAGKILIEEGLQSLQEENRRLIEQAEQKEEILKSLKLELDNTIGVFESKLEEQGNMVADKDKEIASLKEKIKSKEKDLTDKYAQLQNEMITIDSLQDELEQRKADLQQKDVAIVSLTEEVNDLKVSRKWEITSAKKHVEELKSKLEIAKSPEEFEELLQRLRDKNEIIDGLQARLESQELEIKELGGQIEKEAARFEEILGLKVGAELAKEECEKQIEYLRGMLETNGKYAEDLKTELANAYQDLERLKLKHVEDMDMQNRRLEEIVEDLQGKVQETENLRAELEKTQTLVGENVTEEVKRSLETKVLELEQQLVESGEKSQKQLEKMKKLVVNLKKKSALCEELGTRVKELEEALISEKDEKEAKNREIRDKDVALAEKDNALMEKEAALVEKDAALKEKETRVSTMEERMLVIEGERNQALANFEWLTVELNASKQRLDALMRMVVEMGEESFEEMIEKCKVQQQELEEAKDNVRELSVRMQVMEAEYVEQLSIIQNLKTENGMMLSKQTQINERLENAEKESEDRKILLDQLQMELERKESEIVELIAKRESEMATQSPSEVPEKCERCDQCQNLVQSLEARLQERDAQIENLDNELSNSVANFVQMQDNLRINNLGQNRSLQESYNDLLVQYNTMTAANDEIKMTLSNTLRENQELGEKIGSLRELNDTLEERIAAVEMELSTGKKTIESLQVELEVAKEELIRVKLEVDEKDSEKKNLVDKCQELEGSRDKLSDNLIMCHQKIEELGAELESLKNRAEEKESSERSKRDLGAEPAPFFDASKIFGSAPIACDESELMRLREILSEKENTCSSLLTELEQLKAELSFKIQELETEKLKYESEKSNYEAQLESHLVAKQELEGALEVKMNELEAIRIEKEELAASHELCKFKILQLENEMKTSSDAGRIMELEDRASKIQRENELFQLQVNDLTRALEDAKESAIRSFQEVQADLNAALQERDQLSLQINGLTETLKKLEDAAEKPVEQVKKANLSAWETYVEKIEVEEEGWGWNPEEADHPITTPIIPSAEIRLQTKVDELEDQLKDLEAEKAKILEDNSNIQTKCGKLIKKLKEYKFQVDNLQQQLKSRKLTSDLCDLDSVFNDEMNSQIAGLEKALAEAKEEHRKAIAERENLLTRLDVLMAANERHVEMKEKQDMQVEVLEIRNKELTSRLETTQKQLQDLGEVEASGSKTAAPEISKAVEIDEEKYKREINDLKISIDELASENEQLQQLLEEHRTNRLALEAKLTSDSAESLGKLGELNERNAELIKELEKLKEEYNMLRKQYEQSLMDANDQVQAMRQNSDILKEEFARKSEEFDAEILLLRKETEVSVSKVHEELEQALREKEHLTQILDQRVQEVQGLKKESEICTESLKGEAELQIVIRELNQETSAKEVEVENLKKLLIEKEEELLVLKKQAESLESANADLQNRLERVESSLQNLQVELETKNGVVESQVMEIDRFVAVLDEKIQRETELTQKVFSLESDLQQYVLSLQTHEQNQQILQNRVLQADHEVSESRRLLTEKDSVIQEFEQELQKCRQELETSRLEIEQLVSKLQVNEQELERISDLDDNKTEGYNILNLELQAKKQELNEVRKILLEKEAVVEEMKKTLLEKESVTEVQRQTILEKESVVEDLKRQCEGNQQKPQDKKDDVPIFRMGSDDVEHLKAELNQKQLQIEHLESSLSESTYTQIIQELQDTINQLYNEKEHFEMTLASFSQNLKDQLSEKEKEVKSLRQELEVQRQELEVERQKLAQGQEGEDSSRMTRRKRSMDGEEENQRLRDALRAWEQEVQDLRQILAEKDAQLMIDNSYADKEAIERLMSEKEQIRIDAEETLERKLSEKEMQIEEIKLRFEGENERLFSDLKQREIDIENLRIQMEEINSEHDDQLQKKNAEVAFAGSDLEERDRRLAELSITKDVEIQNLKVQMHDRELRIEELQALSDEEERQLTDLKMILESRDQENSDLKQQLEDKLKELELIQNALRRHVTKLDNTEPGTSQGESIESSANELDLALYMLHQRDVRCEELTLELMQLLEERDTLQLRLSNAIRINEELRKGGSSSLSLSSGSLPLVEDPSPSRAEGPVEIAKDALDSSMGDNKEALAQKLSQLHTVGHSKDVRLRDDRELRHSQQMSLLAHKDVLSTLPPEAAARLVNANYTLSRDVQSQSSILMNWLWGKSTPKVMHM